MNLHIVSRVDVRPDGPRRVGERNQITLPADQLSAIGVAPGGDVWIAVNPDRPGTLVILSEAVLTEVFEKGWTSL